VDPLTRLLAAQDDVISRAQALRHMTVTALRHRLDSGRWQRPHPGIYVAHTGQLTPTQFEWVAVLAAGGDRRRVCLAGLSALAGWGLQGLKQRYIDVLTPTNCRAAPPSGVAFHRTRSLPRRLARRVGHPYITLVGRSVVDAVQWAVSDREARLIVAASFQQRLVTLDLVLQAVDETLNCGRRELLLSTAADCAGGSHSLAELDFLALCREHGLPTPTRQAQRKDAQGRRRFLDALFDEWRVAVEIDGAHHLEVGQMWDDAIRSNSLELAGYVVLRYPAFIVRTEPARVAAEIRAALSRAGWRPEGVDV
jgi:hypothetical protein